MQARALGRRFGETAFTFQRRGRPRVPRSSDQREQQRAPPPPQRPPRGPGCGVWRSSLQHPKSPKLPPGRGWRCWLLFICLRETEESEAECRAGARRCRDAPRPPRPANVLLGRAEHPGPPRPLTKGGSGPCTCAGPRQARPCAGRVGRARSAPMLPGRPGRENGITAVPGTQRFLAAWGASMLARPAPSAHPAPPPRGHRAGAGFSLRATLAERPFTAPGLQQRPG
ncbi:basic salivary proline-rich protein 3-like [Pezoporus occidentalis]|uniref:basic salivary proline-rich protein 3-like n=1 Tax=Pezoporus occidentalis TaxID=407982 RepID=UPI002F9122F8